MPVVGVDVGVRRLAMACPDQGWSDYVDLGRQHGRNDHFARHEELSYLKDWCWSAMVDWDCDVREVDLVIERTTASHATTAATGEAMNQTIGVVLAADDWRSATLVAQSTWKAQLLGYGHADKEDINAWLRLSAPALHAICSTEDEVDAMCIGLYGVMLHDGVIEVPAPKKRARKKVSP